MSLIVWEDEAELDDDDEDRRTTLTTISRETSEWDSQGDEEAR
jgi:hypothetical protein